MSAANSSECRCCGASALRLFETTVLSRPVAYFECPQCGYVQTQSPHWLEQAYAEALNISDTGIVRRSQRSLRVVVATMAMLGCLHEPMLDFAGGSGLLVRMLRDVGVDARWRDAHATNVFARGLEHAGEAVALVTAFEVLEHLVHPLAELERLCSLSDAVLLSTELIGTPAPGPDNWGYYGREHGQHIGFFRERTLQFLARQLGWHLHSDGRSFHLFTRRPMPAWRWRLVRSASRPLFRIARLRLRSLIAADNQRFAKPT